MLPIIANGHYVLIITLILYVTNNRTSLYIVYVTNNSFSFYVLLILFSMYFTDSTVGCSIIFFLQFVPLSLCFYFLFLAFSYHC